MGGSYTLCGTGTPLEVGYARARSQTVGCTLSALVVGFVDDEGMLALVTGLVDDEVPWAMDGGSGRSLRLSAASWPIRVMCRLAKVGLRKSDQFMLAS